MSASNLVSVEELRPLVQAGLTDTELDLVIERVESELTDLIGAHYTGATITETLNGGYGEIFTKRPISSVSSVTEYANLQDTTGTSLTENTDFYVWGDQGCLERIGNTWGRSAVVYVPQDDRKKRKQAVIDLARIAIQQSAVKQESLSGAYSWQAPDNWELEKRRVVRRLQFSIV